MNILSCIIFFLVCEWEVYLCVHVYISTLLCGNMGLTQVPLNCSIPYFLLKFKFSYYNMCSCDLCVWAEVYICRWERPLWELVLPPWVPGIKFRLSCLCGECFSLLAISQTLCIFWNCLSLNSEVTGWVGFQACTITMVILCGCWASKLKSSCMCGQYFIMEPSPQPLSSIISNNFPLLRCMCFYVQCSWTLQELGFYTCRQT